MTHAPLRNDADPDWQALHQAAEVGEPQLSRLLLLAFAGLVSRQVLGRILGALRLGQIEAAMQAVPVAQLLALQPVVESALMRAAVAGSQVAREAEMVIRLGSSAGLPVAELTFWARQRSAALVAGITEQTRRALREALVKAIQSGVSPARAAKLLEPVIGLNTVQTGALLTRYDELVADGVTAARRDAILGRYAAQLRRQRARVIARHELLQAANEGRRSVWERNVADGLIAPDRWEREWVAIVPSDGRTCPVCEELDGQRAPLNGAYPNGSGGPPEHVLCRCTEVLTRRAA